MFTWQLLLVCIGALVLATIYLFYFNRLIAIVINRIIRVLTWSKPGGGRICIDFDSISFSFLTGSLIFKNMKYSSSNQTIKMVKCVIVWKYWLLQPRHVSSESDSDLKDGFNSDSQTKPSTRPCRFHIDINGLDWHMYNRTAAFDEILRKMANLDDTNEEPPRDPVKRPDLKSFPSRITINTAATPRVFFSLLGSLTDSLKRIRSKVMMRVGGGIPTLELIDCLPMSFEISDSAISVGNPSTRTLLIGQCNKVVGTYTVTNSASPFDIYRQILTLEGSQFKLFLKPNPGFEATNFEDGSKPTGPARTSTDGSRLNDFERGHWEPRGTAFFGGVAQPGEQLKDSPIDHFGEYAMEERILDCSGLRVTYVVDVAGLVQSNCDEGDEINEPPEWSIEIRISGGIIRYGPWADRQRVDLQRAFFPPAYQDSDVAVPRRLGEERVFPSFRILVEIDDGCTIQLPFREGSKNWQWDGKSVPIPLGRRRTPAILNLTCNKRSALRYVVPMLADASGYQASLDVLLHIPTMNSSANDVQFLRAADIQISARLHSPLEWNHLHRWNFDISVNCPEIRLVRDYVTVLTDLGKDWSSGPPSDFHRWVPTVYTFQIEFKDYALQMFLNDHNIIDYPQTIEENATLLLRGSALRADIHMPLDNFRPDFSTIPFAVSCPDMRGMMTFPRWDTRSVFASERSMDIIRVSSLRVESSFRYFSEFHEEHLDQLSLNITISGLRLKLFGWVVRRLMIARENYFGTFTNFTTLTEYIVKRKKGFLGDLLEDKYRPNTLNPFNLRVSACFTDSFLLFPAGLPGYEVAHQDQQTRDMGLSLLGHIPEWSVDLEAKDDGMELDIQSPSIKLDVKDEVDQNDFFVLQGDGWSTETSIEGVRITATRLFGPKPQALTYLCLWSFELRSVAIELSAFRIKHMELVFQTFMSNFKDTLNTPAADLAVKSDPDMTIFDLRVHSTSIVLASEEAALQFLIPCEARMHFNNVPGQLYNKVLDFAMPLVHLRVLHRIGGSQAAWLEVGGLQMSLECEQLGVLRDSSRRSFEQKAFVHLQDLSTQRATSAFHQLISRRNEIALKPDCITSLFPTSPSPHSPMHHNDLSRETDGLLGEYLPFLAAFAKEERDQSRRASFSLIKRSQLAAMAASNPPLPSGVVASHPVLRTEFTKAASFPTLSITLHSLNAFLTPAASFTLESLLSKYYEQWPGPELLLDELLAHFVASTREPKGPPTGTIKIDVTTAEIHFFAVATSSLIPPGVVPRRPDHATLRFAFDRTHVLMHHDRTLSTTRIHAPQLYVELLGPGEGGTAVSSTPLSAVTLEETFLNLSASTAEGSFSDVKMNLAPGGPSLGAILLSRFRDSAKLGHTADQLAKSLASRNRFFLWSVLSQSRSKTILNPLSSAKGSYLAASQTLRFDVSYNMLTYLRLCLAAFSHDERVKLINEAYLEHDRSVLLLDVEQLVRQRWAEWTSNPDGMERVQLPLLQTLYKKNPQGRFAPTGSFTALIQWQNVAIQEESNPNMRNTLTVTGGRIASASESQLMIAVTDKTVVGNPSALHITSDVQVENCVLQVYPNVLPFFEEVLRIARLLRATSTSSANTEPPKRPPTRQPLVLEVIMSAERIRLRASAQNLLLDAGTSELRIFASASFQHKGQVNEEPTIFSRLSTNVRVIAGEFFIRARSADRAFQADDSDILASVVASACKASAGLQYGANQGTGGSFLINSGRVLCTVPRSATRTYQFIDEWRANYLPALHTMFQGILKELKPSGQIPSSVTRRSPQLQSLVGVCRLSTFEVALQVTHGVWLHWNITDVLADCQSSVSPATGKAYLTGSLRLTEQVFHVGSADAKATRTTLTTIPRSGIKLILPCLSVSGYYSHSSIKASAQLEYFKLSLKPQYFDDFLMVQKNLGSNYYDLLDLIAATRRKRANTNPALANKAERANRFSVSFLLKGFQVKVKGPTSSQVLHCSNISGGLMRSGHVMWKIAMRNLTLSLSPVVLGKDPSELEGLDLRSAFISIDLESKAVDDHLAITLSRLHAVMSPSSVGEFGDLIDYMQVEMRKRQEQRAAELSDIRSKTLSLLKTLELDDGVQSMQNSKTWFSDKEISVHLTNFGVAFPLEGTELLPSVNQTRLVRAFLFSISNITFNTERVEFGKASLENLSFQFVESFVQGRPESFNGLAHECKNRLLYPDMSAVIKSDKSTILRRLKVGCEISGFVLNLDPTIIDHMFALVNVYRRGKERLSRLSAFYAMEAAQKEQNLSAQKNRTSHSLPVPTSNILISLHFRSGTIVMRPTLSTDSKNSDRSILTPEETIKLPSLTVWAEFKATPYAQKLSVDRPLEPASLLLKALIHPSRNVLRPSILRFLTQVTHGVEHQLGVMKPDAVVPPLTTPSMQPKEGATALDLMSSMQISFNIQIDRSQLELTCQPDVNVLAGLQWDSGGFLITVSEGARLVCLTGVVEGLRANLKHGYLREKCAEINARNIAFTIAVDKVEDPTLSTVNVASVVVDTELSASFRFSRLQDVLCFRAVWLDHIPVFTRPLDGGGKEAQPHLVNSSGTLHRNKLVSVLLLRARRLGLFVDMGSSVASIQLNLNNLRARTHLNDSQSDIEISIAEVAATFEHTLSGYAFTPNFRFRTVRQRHGLPAIEGDQAQTLMMSLTSGTLDIDLRSEDRRILYYHAQPVHVIVHDDISGILGKDQSSQRSQLNLFFAVIGSEIVAMATVKTIPHLLALFGRIRSLLDEQREGAEKESEAFRHALSLKPKNPLTAVANAMIQSAKSRLKEKSSNLGYIMVQHMSLQLTKLQLAVFYRQALDAEMALFTGFDIQAKLDHFTDSTGISFRNKLNLALTSMSIARMSGLNHGMAQRNEASHGSDRPPPRTASMWLADVLQDSNESIIFKLPAMEVTMGSQDISSPLDDKPRLEYDFWSAFPSPPASSLREVDTEVTLNISLYKWLAEFRSRLMAELAIVNEQSGTSSSQTSSPPKLVDSPDTDLPGGLSGIPAGRLRSLSNASTINSVTHSGLFEYVARSREITRPKVRQLGDATPDILHPFFSKQAGFNIEEELPAYIHEYATVPLEQLMKVLLKIYSRQFKYAQLAEDKSLKRSRSRDSFS